MSYFLKIKNRYFPDFLSSSQRKNEKVLHSFLLPIKIQYIPRQILIDLSLLILIFSFPCYSKSIQKKEKKPTWEQYWTQITLIDDPKLFQSKKRKDRLVSVTQTDPVNLNQLPDSKQFFKKLDKKKKSFLKLYQLLQIGM